MAGRLRGWGTYLGLIDDEEQDEYYDEPGYDPRDVRTDSHYSDRSEPVAAVRAAPRGAGRTEVRRPSVVDVRDSQPGSSDGYRITTVQPRTYNEARTIGEHFREGVPVIINLTEMDDADAKRLVDFAAGLIFGLHGSIERVTNKVFLLSPSNVDVSAEDKARIAQNGFFNQS